MPYENITQSEKHALEHLKGCMNRFIFGTKEYELARHSFAEICKIVRAKERSDKIKIYQKL